MDMFNKTMKGSKPKLKPFHFAYGTVWAKNKKEAQKELKLHLKKSK